MENLKEYSIYCTDEQTKRAIKLGVNLQEIDDESSYCLFREDAFYIVPITNCTRDIYIKPTVEQMLGWLREEKGLHIDTTWSYNQNTGDEYTSLIWRQYAGIMMCLENELMIEIKPEKTYKESVLKCIDRALYELERKQKPTLQWSR